VLAAVAADDPAAVVKQLLASKGSVHDPVELVVAPAGTNADDSSSSMSLLSAAISTRSSRVALLLLTLGAAGGLTVSPSSRGFTPLMHACAVGDLETVELLLRVGHHGGAAGAAAAASAVGGARGDVDVNAVTSAGASALFVAAQLGQVAVLRRLLRHEGIDVDICVRGSVLTGARSSSRNAEGFELVGATPLYVAAQRGHHEVVLALLQAGVADANLGRTTDGATALHAAVDAGHLPVVESLVEEAALADTMTVTDATPLVSAVLRVSAAAACHSHHESRWGFRVHECRRAAVAQAA
jgi:ankyrin repeat protein